MHASLSSSKNLLIIDLEKSSLKDIVNQKLQHALCSSSPPDDLFFSCCEPVKQAFIETILNLKKENQIKASKTLGINRNTLRKKLCSYQNKGPKKAALPFLHKI